MPNLILKHFVPIPDIRAMDSFLFIGPHPDDIEVSCAPTVRALTDAGKRVSFLIVTDGRMGTDDPALWGDALACIRHDEAIASAKLLGVSDVRFLGFHDGGMWRIEDAAADISRAICEIKPDCVVSCDPDARSECHMDHIKTGMATKMSFMMAPHAAIMESLGMDARHLPKALAFYNTDRPNRFIRIGKTAQYREKALECHGSQFTGESVKPVLLYYRLRALRLGSIRMGSVDGYRVLAPVHLHCFPEASRW